MTKYTEDGALIVSDVGGGGGTGDTSSLAQEETLAEVRDRLPTALVNGRIPVDVASLTVTVGNTQLEIVNDVGNPIPVSGTVAFSNSAINVGNFPSTQAITGTVTADTELPAAAALADTTANPTTPSVGALNFGFNGTTWDRIRAGMTGTLTAIAGVLNVFPLGRYNASTITLNDGEYRGFQLDPNANLKVNPGYLVLSRSSSSALEASRVVKNSSGDLFRVKGYSTAAGFIQVHNSAAVPAAAAVPIVSFAVAANANFEEDYADLPYNFSTGITVVFSSTQATYTAGTASVWFEVGYL